MVDTLKQHFYEDQIFMDIDKIEPGVDFTDVISTSLEQCDVMLAVIGPHWFGVHASGGSRIKDANDWVRLEIATALQRGIRVVPVLVDGAELPQAEDLPEDLQPLLRRQAYEISNKRWRYDTENLAAFLEKSVGIPRRNVAPPVPVSSGSPVMSIVKWSLAGLGSLFIILVAYYATNEDNTDKKQPEQLIDTRQPNFDNGGQTDADSTKVNRTDGGAKPAPGPEVVQADIDGIWDDANGLYYLVITTYDDQPEIASFSLAGQKTGEGLVKLNRRSISYSLNIINFGLINAKGTVSEDENTIQGNTTVQSNGQPVTEALVLRRRP